MQVLSVLFKFDWISNSSADMWTLDSSTVILFYWAFANLEFIIYSALPTLSYYAWSSFDSLSNYISTSLS